MYWGSPAITFCGKIVTVWPGRPEMVLKTFVVTVVGSLKGLAVAAMRDWGCSDLGCRHYDKEHLA